MSYNIKLDKTVLNKGLSQFIPPVCHIDDRTLLTKNGELIQTIAIEGINSRFFKRNLALIRENIREAIHAYTNHNNAIWIHTVRKKENLDDTLPYPTLLSSKLHRLWRDKNHWDDKFVNTLYITIVHSAGQLDTHRIFGFVNSFFVKKIYDFHNKYIDTSKTQLTKIVNDIITHLKDFDPQLLSIKEEGDAVISEPMGLFTRIALLKEEKFIIENQDLSLDLATQKIDIGSDKIEIQSGEGKRFAAMLGLKGYQEIQQENLDLLLQVPAEMIITEMFYYIDKKAIQSFYMSQYNLTKIASNTDINTVKYFDKIFQGQDKSNRFCNQQISIMCIGDNINELDAQLSRVSKALSSVGISHVREDIAIEQSYFSQMPGNFSFLTRLYPNLVEHTVAFGALHNLPLGNKDSKWGKALTIMRSAKGIPYFFNFYNKNNIGHTFIIGQNRSGRTVLTNFLLSEATKYKPKILYIQTDHASQIFLQAIGGTSCHTLEGCSPLYKNSGDVDYIKRLITMMLFSGNKDVITAEEKKIIDDSAAYLSQGKGAKSLSDFIKTYKFGKKNLRIQKDLAFCASNQYKNFFDTKSNEYIADNDILGVDFSNITNSAFKSGYYPEDQTLLDEYYHNIELNSNARSAVLYSLIRTICSGDSTRPKIIVVDNLFEMFSTKNLQYNDLANLFEYITQNNGIVIANVDINQYNTHYKIPEWEQFVSLFPTQCIFSPEVVSQELQKIFSLTKEEFHDFLLLSPSNRMFLMKQDDNLASLELNLDRFPSILKILSAGEGDIKIFNEVILKFGNKGDEWLKRLYEQFNKDISDYK